MAKRRRNRRRWRRVVSLSEKLNENIRHGLCARISSALLEKPLHNLAKPLGLPQFFLSLFFRTRGKPQSELFWREFYIVHKIDKKNNNLLSNWPDGSLPTTQVAVRDNYKNESSIRRMSHAQRCNFKSRKWLINVLTAF